MSLQRRVRELADARGRAESSGWQRHGDLAPRAARAEITQRDTRDEHDALDGGERRLVSVGSQRLQRRYLEEALHHEHEEIEIETNHRGDGVYPAGPTLELRTVERPQRDREHHARDDAGADGGSESVER